MHMLDPLQMSMYFAMLTLRGTERHQPPTKRSTPTA